MGDFQAKLLPDAGLQLLADQPVDHRVDGWWNYDEKDAAEFLKIGRQRGEAASDDDDQRGHFVDHVNNQVYDTRAQGFAVDVCATVFDSGFQDSEVGKGDDQEDACTQHPGDRQACKTRLNEPLNPDLLKVTEVPDPLKPPIYRYNNR